MFNFLDSKLSPKIVCQFPATDNYEVENLISENYLNRARGFIAYSAIKPPVNLEIEFICPVNIHYIILNTTVGSQKCSGIEIFAKNSTINYTSICKAVYSNSGVVFCNSRKYSNTKLPPKFNSEFHLAFFKSNTFKCFLNATAIKVVIFRTEKSVPCLGTVEVWGTTSKSCSVKTAQTIRRIMEKPVTSGSNVSDIKTEEFKIPDDFKDDLTYEIMSIPMTLPSGKTVDQSTLEKHINSEISFGRKPCDPFTGIKFTDKIKPVLNMALKSRIDMFLLQNSHREELCNIKRTVGITGVSSSRDGNSKKRKFDSNNIDSLDEAILKAKQCSNFTSFSDESIVPNSCSKCNKQIHFLYAIPCQHRYCRSCILIVCEDLKCSLCDKHFVKSDVKKLYIQ